MPISQVSKQRRSGACCAVSNVDVRSSRATRISATLMQLRGPSGPYYSTVVLPPGDSSTWPAVSQQRSYGAGWTPAALSWY
jgi:hypothetical protein